MAIPHETIQAVLDAWKAADFPDAFECPEHSASIRFRERFPLGGQTYTLYLYTPETYGNAPGDGPPPARIRVSLVDGIATAYT